MKNTFLIAGISLLGLAKMAQAQDTIPISLAEIQQRLSDANLQVQLAQKATEAAQADFKQTHALFLPSVTASHTAMVTTNPLMAFGSKLNQEILTTQDFDPALLNDPDRIENYATRIEVKQPLINVDGWSERKAARSKLEAYRLQAERTREFVELEVKKAYMQLQVTHQAVSVLQQAEETAQVLLQWATDYADQGLVQRTDVLAVQVRVTEVRNQRQHAESQVRNASDYLAFLLNAEQPHTVFKPTESISEPAAVVFEDSRISDSRKDLAALSHTTEAYQRVLQSRKWHLLPRLNAFGSYELYDNEIAGLGAQGYTLGAQLSWDLFDGYKSYGQLERARVDYEKAQVEADQFKAKSQLELNQAKRQWQDARNNVALTKLALEQSREAYRIRSDRFRQGLERTTDLLTAETQVVQKELAYNQAIFEYAYAQQFVVFLTQ